MNRLEKAATKLLKENLALKKGEKILIISDRRNCPIFKSICKSAEDLGGIVTKLKINQNRKHSSPLPKFKNIFIKNNVIIGITDKSITHCPETLIARKKYGARVISMVEVDKNLFLKSIKIDRKSIIKINNILLKRLEGTKKIRIITSFGTYLSIKMPKGKKFKPDDGDSTEKGKLNNFPYGEIEIHPIRIANGTLVVDYSRIAGQKRMKLKLKGGKIISWDRSANDFIKYLKSVKNKNAFRVVELGIGTNPEHKKPIGVIIHDEKIFGSTHIAFGGWGNQVKCPIHEDVILFKPTIIANDKIIMKEGKLLN